MRFYSSKPLTNYISKDSTQQSLFLSKYPSFDGREIKIAVIDGGVDVSLEGLQKTSNGLPKIIDCFDFSGVGDVDTSIIKEMNSENILIGISGRKLKIPIKWINPSGKWHLGVKSLYKPYSATSSECSEMSDESIILKLPEMDCIVWNDGQRWLACIDTFRDLEKAKVLTNFRDEHEYGFIINESKISYCITIHNNGNLLEIFTSHIDHGSVVAQIAAAHFPKNPEKDGLAPGAQIISMNALVPGKQNFISVEAIKRSLLKCIEMKVDIINYSAGTFEGDFEIIELINALVKKHNCLIFKSAGNHGPFYATINSGHSNADLYVQDMVFTIGALLTAEMKKSLYNVFDDIESCCPPVIFEFSSKGTCKDGSQGIDFVAPGAAITDVSQFHSVKNKLFQGTSYATPNAAGVVACMLSALKSNSIQYSPFSIKFALFKTAYLPMNGRKLEFGNGIIQIGDAFDYYRNKEICKIPIYSNEGGGIVFAQKFEDKTIKSFDIALSDFINTKDGSDAKWILQLSTKASEYINLSKKHDNDTYSVEIDTSKLEEGNLNFAEIAVMDRSNPSLGSVFNIPITAIIPLKVTERDNYHIEKEICLCHENSYHIFLHPFFESKKYCEIKITNLEHSNLKLCIQYAVSDDIIEFGITDKIIMLKHKSQSQTYGFAVEKNEIYEICIYQLIGASPSKAKLKIEFQFSNIYCKTTLKPMIDQLKK